MPIPNLPAQEPVDLAINNPEDVDEHLAVVNKKIDSAKVKKTIAYKQLEEMRKKSVNDILAVLRSKGIDVNSPEALEAFLASVEQVDPDLAQGLRFALQQLLPDQHEMEHVDGKSLPDYLFASSRAPNPLPSMQPQQQEMAPEEMPTEGVPPEEQMV